MKRTAFDSFHPAVAFVYFAVMLALSMAALQPAYLAIALVGALGYSVVLRGAKAALRGLAWQIPLVAVVALANPLFSASGLTEVFRLGERAFYLESFVYGACMGVMLACVLLTFANASQVLSSDKLMALFGNAVPTVGLMASMVARLVPQFVRRGREIGAVQEACTAAKASARGGWTRAAGMRLVSVLVGWSMEDSLETADAMKARGWGAVAFRSTYKRYRFRRLDGIVVACELALAAICAVAAWTACSEFEFYPTIRGFAPWWNYVPFVLLAAVPLAMEVRERASWKAGLQ